jgi:tetratricopeptide (TPR) repeat protein
MSWYSPLIVNPSERSRAANARSFYEEGCNCLENPIYVDIHTAIRKFRDAVNIKPDFVEAWWKLACCLHTIDQKEEALRAALEATKHFSSLTNETVLTDTHWLLGEIYREQNRNDLAIAEYERSLRYTSSSNTLGAAMLYGQRGFLLEREGDLVSALESQKKALESLENSEEFARGDSTIRYFGKLRILDVKQIHATIYVNMGNAQLQLEQLDEAIASLKMAIQINPMMAMAYHNLGCAYLKREELESARTHFQEALRLDPEGDAGKRARHWLPLCDAESFARWKEWNTFVESVPELAEMRTRSVTDPTYARRLAEMLEEVTARSAEDLKALRDAPDYPHREASHHAYEMWQQTKDDKYLNEAYTEWKQALSLSSNPTAEDWNDFGPICRELKKFDEAHAAYDKAIEMNPNQPRYHFNKGLVYWFQSGEGHNRELIPKAIEYFDKAVRLDPQYVRAHYQLACAYLILDKPEVALESIQKAVESGLDDCGVYVVLGTIAFHLGQLKKAIKAFRIAIERAQAENRRRHHLYYYLGMCHSLLAHQTGEFENLAAAEQALTQFLDLARQETQANEPWRQEPSQAESYFLTHYTLGHLYEQLNNPEQSANHRAIARNIRAFINQWKQESTINQQKQESTSQQKLQETISEALNAGYLASMAGNVKRALCHYHKAEQDMPENWDPIQRITCYRSLGACYTTQNYEVAKTYFEKCLRIAGELHTPQGILEQIRTYSGLGNLMRLQRIWDAAIEYYRKQLECSAQSGAQQWEARAYLGIDDVLLDKSDEAMRRLIFLLDRNDDTISMFQMFCQTQGLSESETARLWEQMQQRAASDSEGDLMQYYEEIDTSLDESSKYARRALRLAEQNRFPRIAFEASFDLAYIKQTAIRLNQITQPKFPMTLIGRQEQERANAYWLAAIEQLEDARRRLSVEHLKRQMISRASYLYSIAIIQMLIAGEPERAYHYLERGKGIGLLDLVTETQSHTRPQREEIDIEDIISSASSEAELLSPICGKPLTAAEVQRDVLANEGSLLIEYYLDDISLGAFVLSVESFQEYPLLGPRAQALRRLQTRQTSGADADKSSSLLSEMEPEDFWKLVKEFDRNIGWSYKYDEKGSPIPKQEDQAKIKADAGKLYDILIRPLEPLFLDEQGQPKKGVERLVIVPHGILHHLPFCALYDTKRECYLIKHIPIVQAPSASVLAECAKKRSQNMEPVKYLGLANPGKDRALTGLEVQVINLGTYLSSDNLWVYIRDAATIEALLENRDSTFIVLATHGYWPEEKSKEEESKKEEPVSKKVEPFDASIQMGSKCPNLLQDKQLRVRDIFRFFWDAKLNCSLLCLMTCWGGKVNVSSGDELLGLIRAWLFAGARSLLVNHWPLHTTRTEEFLEIFYEYLGEAIKKPEDVPLDKAKVLQKTQVEWVYERKSSEEEKHPYYWAFTLIGDHRL